MPKKKESHHALLKMTALGAAALGAYYLYGSKNAKKHQKKVKGWMLKAKGEVLDAIEKLEGLDEEAYDRIVDRVTKKYKKLKSVNNTELAALAKELKSHWREFAKEARTNTPRKKTSRKKKSPGK